MISWDTLDRPSIDENIISHRGSPSHHGLTYAKSWSNDLDDLG